MIEKLKEAWKNNYAENDNKKYKLDSVEIYELKETKIADYLIKFEYWDCSLKKYIWSRQIIYKMGGCLEEEDLSCHSYILLVDKENNETWIINSCGFEWED